jgi:gas vesicle protein
MPAGGLLSAAPEGAVGAGLLRRAGPKSPWKGPTSYRRIRNDDPLSDEMFKDAPHSIDDYSEAPARELARRVREADPERIKRAEEMDFDTDLAWFHGTPTPEQIESFDPTLHGRQYGRDTKYDASFAASRPDVSEDYLAKIYEEYPKGEKAFEEWYSGIGKKSDELNNKIQALSAERNSLMDKWDDKSYARHEQLGDEINNLRDEMMNLDQNREEYIKSLDKPEQIGGILPVFLRRGKTLFSEWEGNEATSLRKISSEIKKAAEGGYDSAILKNIRDSELGHQAVIFDPRNIRSIFAQFKDPNSANLLAGNPKSLSAAGLLAEPRKEPKPKNLLDFENGA